MDYSGDDFGQMFHFLRLAWFDSGHTFMCQSTGAVENGHIVARDGGSRICGRFLPGSGESPEVDFFGPCTQVQGGRSCPQGHGPRK